MTSHLYMTPVSPRPLEGQHDSRAVVNGLLLRHRPCLMKRDEGLAKEAVADHGVVIDHRHREDHSVQLKCLFRQRTAVEKKQ